MADGGVMVVLATLSSGHSRCTSFSSLTTDRNLKCLCTLRSSPPLLQCRAFVSLSPTREIPFGPEPNPCRDGVYVPVQKYAQRFEHVCFKVSFRFWVTTADDCPPRHTTTFQLQAQEKAPSQSQRRIRGPLGTAGPLSADGFKS